MRICSRWIATGAAAVALGALGCADDKTVDDESLGTTEEEVEGTRFAWNNTVERTNTRLFREGRGVFRHNTFGSEHFFGDTLKLHQAIAGTRGGGIGDGRRP